MSVRIIIGDVRVRLGELPDASVDCCVTSPPYYGLRDYGTAKWSGGSSDCPHIAPATGSTQNKGNAGKMGTPFRSVCGLCGAVRADNQIGLEETPDAYIAELVAVFGEVRRVLKDNGTLWLNLGDSYSGYHGNKNAEIPTSAINGWTNGTNENKRATTANCGGGIKTKDLLMIPARVAMALQADGWWLRSEIIWAKPNPMPESVTDRPTSSHEKIYLLSKSERYHYDADSIAEAATYVGLTGQDESGFKDPKTFNGKHSDKQRGHSRRHAGFNDRRDAMTKTEQCSGLRNKRNVWTVATHPYAEAHFATFPPALIEPCIKAGCPKSGTVLDPFGGAGTTGLVADRLGRSAILVELNPEYAGIAERRIRGDAPMFADVAAA